jgi:dTDP-4-amino-4,6-dideoxygalactose transaminase
MRVPLNDLARAARRERGVHAEAMLRVADSGWYILGDEGRRFEAAFAAHVGASDALGVANGTDALELALRALGVGPAHDVVTAANAGMYASTAIRRCGARPAYADVADASMCVDVRTLEAAVTPATAAVIVTHLYGRLADVEAIAAWCAQQGLPLVEDCAQAHGAARGGRRAGAFGTLGCFSFYPTKNLGALGDAGAVVTSDDALAAKLRALRQYGWQGKYDVRVAGGVNSRLDELQAAVLNLRLATLDARNARRQAIARAYSSRIRHPAIVVPDAAGDDYVAHLYVVRTRSRASLQRHLAARDIATDVHYPIPDHRQAAHPEAGRASLPVTERLAAEVLTLPCFPELADDEVDAVVEACNAWRDTA